MLYIDCIKRGNNGPETYVVRVDGDSHVVGAVGIVKMEEERWAAYHRGGRLIGHDFRTAGAAIAASVEVVVGMIAAGHDFNA